MKIHIKQLGLTEYIPTWEAMREFTQQRNENTPDEIWLLEHPAIFTQGQAGKEEHILDQGSIPVVQIDRGGQVTYHGPGQLICYVLLNLRRLDLTIKKLVSLLEQSIIDLLESYNIISERRDKAPGIYVNQKKIAALGLRVRKGCSYHGLSLNIKMDLEPFQRINPCGYAGMKVTQLSDLVSEQNLKNIHLELIGILCAHLNYQPEDINLETSLPEFLFI
ncbi:MAG: lipoyl(octanoyl) transferase LipB [Gammaproteobacteria bacterium]